jgi:hypothetical protein
VIEIERREITPIINGLETEKLMKAVETVGGIRRLENRDVPHDKSSDAGQFISLMPYFFSLR